MSEFGPWTPDFSPLKLPEIRLPENVTNPAGWTCHRLIDNIRAFEADLDNEHEVGARLVAFGQSVVFHIDYIKSAKPHIITFMGTDENGSKVHLVQHWTQLSVLLIALKKRAEQPKRIGFEIAGSEGAKGEAQ
jgi:hypothetical protein